MVDAPMNKGGSSQPEAMFSVRYYKYRFESCPDYYIIYCLVSSSLEGLSLSYLLTHITSERKPSVTEFGHRNEVD